MVIPPKTQARRGIVQIFPGKEYRRIPWGCQLALPELVKEIYDYHIPNNPYSALLLL
jgi:hypothetical protein